MTKVKVAEVTKMLKGECEVEGNLNAFFLDIKPIGEESTHSLIWISPAKKNKLELISKTPAKIVLCDKSLSKQSLPKGKTYILVADPRLVFCRILKAYFPSLKKIGVDPSSEIHSEAIIGNNSFIGAGSTVINNISIGRNCLIAAGATIYKDIKDNTIYKNN